MVHELAGLVKNKLIFFLTCGGQSVPSVAHIRLSDACLKVSQGSRGIAPRNAREGWPTWRSPAMAAYPGTSSSLAVSTLLLCLLGLCHAVSGQATLPATDSQPRDEAPSTLKELVAILGSEAVPHQDRFRAAQEIVRYGRPARRAVLSVERATGTRPPAPRYPRLGLPQGSACERKPVPSSC